MKQDMVKQLLNAEFAADFFEQNLPGLNLGRFKLLRCETTPLKLSKTGGKSVLQFTLLLEHKAGARPVSKTIIGAWRPDGRNERVFLLLQKLWQKGFDGKHRNKICEPIAYMGKWNLLLTSKAHGVELEQMLANGNGSFEPAFARTAKWLARLHQTKLAEVRRYSVREDQRALDGWSEHLRRLYPELTERLHDLVEQILVVEESTTPNDFVLTHGDFHPENIFVGENEVTATDFERSLVFDPAADLGYFIAQVVMKTRRGKYQGSLKKNVGVLRRLFLEEYAKEMGTNAGERVPGYEARAYLEILHYIYWGLGVKADPADFELWLKQAENCLHSLGANA